MKKISSLTLLAAVCALTACTADDSRDGVGQEDVRLNVTVGGTFTRSNPIGTDTEQSQFSDGDQVKLTNGSQTATYTLNGGEWTTAGTPVKWQTKSGTFKACYPSATNTADQGFIQADQSTIANLVASDYMTQTVDYTSIPDDRILNVQLQRQTARVIFCVNRFKSEFDGKNPTVSSLSTISTTEVPSGASTMWESITPYYDGSKYIALVAPTTADDAKQFVTLKVTTDDNPTGKTLSITGIPAMEAGKSYTYNLVIGNDKVSIGGISVASWDSGPVLPGGEAEFTGLINGRKFVDLGLPSGLLWAETNLGATLPADDGDYYAWGETATKTEFSWSNYAHGTGSQNLTKYNTTDKKSVLEKDDDAAYKTWGSPCRMPTKADFEELLDTENCECTWTSRENSNGASVNGYQVTSKTNGNSIFFPASGYNFDGTLFEYNSAAQYWSSSLRSSYVCYSYSFFSSDSYTHTAHIVRKIGASIRPVADP